MSRRARVPWPATALAFATLSSAGADEPAPPAAAPIPANVTVTAERLRVQPEVDRIVYTVANDVASDFGTVGDILSAIPSVDVDGDGNLSLRGDANVLVLLDGRPMPMLAGASLADALQQIPAGDIERIEVLTAPPAEFKAEGTAGVINLVTRRHRERGTTGMVQAGAGNHERGTAGARITHLDDGWHVGANVSLRDDYRLRDVTASQVAPDPATGVSAASRYALSENLRRHFSYGRLEAGGDLDASRKLAVQLGFGGRTGSRWFDQFAAASEPVDAPPVRSERDSRGREWSQFNDQRLTFDQSFADPGESLAVMVHRNGFHEREGYAYANYALGGDGVRIGPPSRDALDLAQDDEDTEATVDWTLPLGARRLKAGLDLHHERSSYGRATVDLDPITGQPVGSTRLDDVFRYRVDDVAAYASLLVPLGAWSALPGLRYESLHGEGVQLTDGTTTERHLGRLYPSLHLERGLADELTLTLAAARRVTQPDPESLNPYVDRQNIYNLSAGNPGLRAEDTASYEAGIRRDGPFTVGANVYYRINHDSIATLSTVVAEGVLLTTMVNLARDTAAGVELTAGGQLGSYWTVNVTANPFRSEIDLSGLGIAGLRTTTGVSGKATLEFRPVHGQTLQAVFTSSGRRLTPQGYVETINQLNLGYRRMLTPRLTLTATLTDVFQGQVRHAYWSTPVLAENYERRVVGRMAYLGVSYSFGVSHRDKAPTFEYDN